MIKRSQITSHQIISIRFRFIKLPVVWEVLAGASWEQFKATRLRAYAKRRGKELSFEEKADFERRIPAGPLLLGRIRKIQTVDSEVLSEITDVWRMREEFFGLPENNLDKLAAFLDKVGAWPSSNEPNPSVPGHGMRFPVIVQPGEVWAFRDDLKDVLLDKNREWFKRSVTPVSSKPRTWLDLFSHHRANDFNLHFELSDVVAGVVSLTNARHMLFATVLADVARGTRFKICARKGCLQPFPITSKHAKKFHSPKCGHLALVQRQRKNEEKKRRAEKRRAGPQEA
jgi:hypothetical protein